MLFSEPPVDLAASAAILSAGSRGRWTSTVRGLPEVMGELPIATLAALLPAGNEPAQSDDDAIRRYRGHVFDLAQQLPPNDSEARNNLAWNLARCPQSNPQVAELAVRMAEAAHRLAPDNADFEHTLGVAYLRSGDWAGAIDTLRRVREKHGSNLIGLDGYPLAFAYAENGDRDTAESWFRAADRNGDGFLSPQEFLGPQDVFRRLDADGDGRIGVAEAEAAEPARPR